MTSRPPPLDTRARRVEETTIDQKPVKADREHDLLSFLSVVFHEYSTFDLNYTLLGVILKESSFDMRPVGPGGAYFSVHKADGKSLLKCRTFNVSFPVSVDVFPELVAIKAPIIKGEVNSARNRKIWTAMAQEVMILRHAHLFEHDNVVSLLGVCWHQSGLETSSIMPALVLEAAEIDLECFLVPGKAVERRKTLGLAIDVVAGVRAIHDCGIAHCDLKPKNILICKHPDLGYTAKVADFGSAILLSTVQDKVMRSGTTEFWQAPECSHALSGEGLKQADMYSAGLIVWNLLTANLAVLALDQLSGQHLPFDEDALGNLDPKEAMLYCLIHATVHAEWEFETRYLESGAEIDGPKPSDIEMILMATVYASPESRCSAKVFLSNLRLLLHKFLKFVVFANISASDNAPESIRGSVSPSDFNPQEQDIWLNPGLGEPTDEDRERIMFFAKSRSWIDETIAGIKSSRPFKMKDLASHKVTHPERYIGTTLKQWKMAKQPAPDIQREVRDSLAVLEADHSFGTMRVTPPPVVDQVYQQLLLVALNTKEPTTRRAEAAYQYALLAIGQLQLHDDVSSQIERCLNMSSLAASLGHVRAQSITSSFYYAFQKSQSKENSNVELEWLQRGVKHGSLAAKRRLQSIDPELSSSAKHALRTRYAGIGVRVPWQYEYASDEDWAEILRRALKSESEQEWTQLLIAFIIVGRTQEAERLIEVVNVNSTNEWQETPLLAACRIGDAHMVRMLLDVGADPNIASVEGVAPMHFLAAFDDEDIHSVAHTLFERGAQLETRSSKSGAYCRTYDSIFGQANGTPLLWAVAADNMIATRVLVELGADPFDTANRGAPTTNEFGKLIWTSPVVYAATKHQYYLLELMLAPQKKSMWKTLKSLWLPSTKHKLNDNKRNFGTLGMVEKASPLSYCVTYAAEGLTKRLLLHGPEHEIAFVKTFEILVRAGVDPLPEADDEDTLMFHAVLHGQPFVINYLMSWNENILRPSPRQWLDLVKLAISLSDHAVFDTLLLHSRAEELDTKSLTELFEFVAATSDDVRFLDPFKSLRDPAQDLADILKFALLRGNQTVMKWFYTTGRCDIARQRDGRSVLGSLILSSKTSVSTLRGIEALLGLEDLPEAIFYDCFTFQGSHLTALQAAVLHFEYWEGRKAAEWSLHTIIGRWSDPMYLNYQVAEGKYKGCTALHLAVMHTNVAAVRYLLDEEADTLDLSILDGRDLTVLDLALLQLKDQKNTMEFWEVPPEKQAAADSLHWSNMLVIIASLGTAGAKPFHFHSAWVRSEPDDLAIFEAGQLKESTFPLIPRIVSGVGDLFAAKEEEIQQLPQPWRKVAGLAVNQAFFIVSEDYAKTRMLELAADTTMSEQGGGEAVGTSRSRNPFTIPQLEYEVDGNAQSFSELVGHLQFEDDGRQDVGTSEKGKERAD